MEENNIVKYEGGIIQRIGKAISLTNKLLSLYQPMLIPYRKGKKWGFCNWNKKIEIECKYDEAYLFSEGLALVKMLGEYFFIDSFVNKVVYYIKDDNYRFDENGRVLQKGFENGFMLIYSPHSRRFGLIDKKNSIVLDCSYTTIKFLNKFIIANEDSDTQWIFSYQGVSLNQESFWQFGPFCEGLARAYNSNSFGRYYGFINEEGRLVIDCIFESLEIMGNLEDENFSCGLASVILNGKRGFIDKTGRWLFESDARYFSDGLAQCWPGNGLEHSNFINTKGEIVFDCFYYVMQPFRDGKCLVRSNNKYGYIDKKGNLIIDFGKVKNEEKKVEITETDKGIVDGLYDKVEEIYCDGKKKVVRYNGQFLPSPSLTDIKSKFIPYLKHCFKFYRYGVVDSTGKLIIPIEYVYLEEKNSRLFHGRHQNESEDGYINVNGTKYWED